MIPEQHNEEIIQRSHGFHLIHFRSRNTNVSAWMKPQYYTLIWTMNPRALKLPSLFHSSIKISTMSSSNIPLCHMSEQWVNVNDSQPPHTSPSQRYSAPQQHFQLSCDSNQPIKPVCPFVVQISSVGASELRSIHTQFFNCAPRMTTPRPKFGSQPMF